nr:winged helix-turn-helix domain-containing protein [Candidatus Freyarchaeota archaeon]
MSDEELEAWRKRAADARLVGNPTEAGRSLRVMQNPVRREIMTLLKDKALTIREIADKLNLEEKVLGFHLQVLEQSFFIKIIDGNTVDLTPPGVAYTRHVIK